MAKRDRLGLTAVRTEGAILPVSILQRIHRQEPSLDGLKPEQYGLAGDRLREAASRAWNALQGPWSNFQSERSKLSVGDSGTSATRNRWIYPLLRELHFGQLDPLRESLKYDGKEFPVSHQFGHAPLHLIGCGLDLDKRTPGAVGAAKMSPHSLLQSCLNATKVNLWGFVSNGLRWRVLRDDNSLSRQSMVEFDLEAIFDGQLYDEFLLFFLICHRSRIQSDRPEDCWLEQWSLAAGEEGKRALNTLRDGVQNAIEALGQGFLKHPANNMLRQRIREGELDKQDYYRQLLRMVYRLLFLFVAEDRGLLLDPKATAKAKELYFDHFSTQRLRLLAERIRGSVRHFDLFSPFKMMLAKLGEESGCPELGLPALGGFLFSSTTAPDLDNAEISNCNLLEAVRCLAITREGGRLARVDYKNLGTEELGSVYESLLELHPDLSSDGLWFELKSALGNERKSSGSYYTPDSLIQCLLDSALEPVVEDAIRRAGTEAFDRAKAILDLKVIDPAVGSGHFLIAAAHRLAKRLAQIRTDEDEPSPIATRSALRDVVGRCLYGIDINPMSAELCKVSLWIEALEPGLPLNFLDHHIQVGNSLIGATPDLLKAGIPDNAYNSIGDADLKAKLKKQNKKEREGQNDLFYNHLNDAQKSAAAKLDTIEQEDPSSLESVRHQEEWFSDFTRDREFENRYTEHDLYLAPFVINDVDVYLSTFVGSGITTQAIRRVEDLTEDQREKIRELRATYRFFHPHVAFPQVFANGGFDVVLGNPPWERVKLQEKEFFAGKDDRVVNASNATTRRRIIESLKESNPKLYGEFEAAKAQAEGESAILRLSGRYPLTGRGDVNTYAVFAELFRSFLKPTGRAGIIVPSGIATDDTTKYFFVDLTETRSISSLYDFENGMRQAEPEDSEELDEEAHKHKKKAKRARQEGERLLFPSVDSRFKFCLLTLTGSQLKSSAPQFAFFCHRVEDIQLPGKSFSLSPADIALLNPNTKTCPIFRSRKDANLSLQVYEKFKILGDKIPSWSASYMRLVDMGDHARSIRFIQDAEESDIPLYESKLIHQFDHRFSSFANTTIRQQETGQAINVSSTDKAMTSFSVLCRYYVDASLTNALFAKYPMHNEDYLLVWRDVTNVTNERTCIASIIPKLVASRSCPAISLGSSKLYPGLLAIMNSFIFDYLCRQKASGVHLNWTLLAQIATPGISQLTENVNLFSECKSYWDFLIPRVLELTYTANDIAPFARDLGYAGPPFVWNDERRFLLRAELDAALFHLYGIKRNDVEYIMDTFPIVKRKDIALHNSYRTKEAILEIYDEMERAKSDTVAPPTTVPMIVRPAQYPANDFDRAICAATLSIVGELQSVSQIEALEVLCLATTGQDVLSWATDEELPAWNQALSDCPYAFFGHTPSDINWRGCKNRLVQTRSSIVMTGINANSQFSRGPEFPNDRAHFGTSVDDWIKIAIEARRRYLASTGLDEAVRTAATQSVLTAARALAG